KNGSGGFDFGTLDGEEEGGGFGEGAPEEGGTMNESESSEEIEKGSGYDFGGGDDDGFSFDLGDAAIDDAEGKKGGKKAKKKKPKVKNETKSHKNENPGSAEEALRRALSHLGSVSKDFDQYAKSLYLKGLAHFSLGEFEPSVDAFREVVRMTDPKKE